MARHVTRRGGPDVACIADAAYTRCADVYERMKSVALAALGVEDDPLTMPHSVTMKIQFGGLLGLRQQLADAAAVAATVTDIDALMRQALAYYGHIEALPYAVLAPTMTSYQLRRRR